MVALGVSQSVSFRQLARATLAFASSSLCGRIASKVTPDAVTYEQASINVLRTWPRSVRSVQELFEALTYQNLERDFFLHPENLLTQRRWVDAFRAVVFLPCCAVTRRF